MNFIIWVFRASSLYFESPIERPQKTPTEKNIDEQKCDIIHSRHCVSITFMTHYLYATNHSSRTFAVKINYKNTSDQKVWSSIIYDDNIFNFVNLTKTWINSIDDVITNFVTALWSHLLLLRRGIYHRVSESCLFSENPTSHFQWISSLLRKAWSGSRKGEIIAIRSNDIDRTGFYFRDYNFTKPAIKQLETLLLLSSSSISTN